MKVVNTFEKNGKQVEVLIDNNAIVYLQCENVQTEVQKIGCHSKQGWYFVVSTDFIKNAFGAKLKGETVAFTSECAKYVEKIQIQMKKEIKRAKEQAEIDALTDGSKLKLHWSSSHKFISEFIYNDIVQEMVDKISKLDIEKHLGREADDIDYGDYDTTKTFIITFAELKKLVKIAEGKATTAEEKMKEEKQKLIEQAKASGEKIEWYRYTVECDDPNEDCDLDTVVAYVYPDGTIKEEKYHNW